MPNKTKLDERWEVARQDIIEAARSADVDVGIMVKISGFESGFNPSARPISSNSAQNKVTQFDGVMAISSAHGYGQFLNATWHEMIIKYGEKYGVENAAFLNKNEANAAEIRNVPLLQAAMLAEFTRENVLKGARLGGPDPDANVYAFHNLGESDATLFLKALKNKPDGRVDEVLGRSVISGNPSLYGDGSRSVSEAYAVMGQQMDRYEKYANEARQDLPSPILGSTASRSETAVVPALPRQNHAFADGDLKQGESGSNVKHVQELLIKFGYRDSHGHPITSDGDFGQKTREAVQAFQRAHGLKDDGIIGARTMEALKVAEQSPLLSNPHHPDHRLYQQALLGIEKLPPNSFQNALERQNAAACMVFEAKVSGLRQIDNVVLSNNGNGIFAIQGAINDPAHHRIHIDKSQAAAEPIEKTTVQIQQEIPMPSQQIDSEQRRVRMA